MKRDVAGPDLFRPAVVRWEDRDGSAVLGSGYPLGPCPASMVEVLATRARGHPERLLVARWEGDGRRRPSWGEGAIQVEAVAGGLAELGVAGRPVMILSGKFDRAYATDLGGLTTMLRLVRLDVRQRSS